MCIVHDLSLHYLYQNIMDAFEQSNMLSPLFVKRVAYYLCTCQTDFYYNSKTIINTQRKMFDWFEENCNKEEGKSTGLKNFKSIVEELKQHGYVDSGTKIAFLSLLKDIDSLNFSKLRNPKGHHETSTDDSLNVINDKKSRIFYAKLVRLKFDLKLCSVKEFIELLSKIDNCAIKYIQIINKCKITLRDVEHLGIRNFMGMLEATIESNFEKNLTRAELNLKRLADSVHYRLAKILPTSEINSLTNVNYLIQSPLNSSLSEISSDDLSSSSYLPSTSATTNTNATYDLINVSSSIKMNIKDGRDLTKTISSFSITLNEDQDSSLLDISRNSIGTTTPLTSSPMSSGSNVKLSFKVEKKTRRKKKSTSTTKKSSSKKQAKNSDSNKLINDLNANNMIQNVA